MQHGATVVTPAYHYAKDSNFPVVAYRRAIDKCVVDEAIFEDNLDNIDLQEIVGTIDDKGRFRADMSEGVTDRLGNTITSFLIEDDRPTFLEQVCDHVAGDIDTSFPETVEWIARMTGMAKDDVLDELSERLDQHRFELVMYSDGEWESYGYGEYESAKSRFGLIDTADKLWRIDEFENARFGIRDRLFDKVDEIRKG